MLLGLLFTNGSVGCVDRLRVKLFRLPDEVLEQVSLILGQ